MIPLNERADRLAERGRSGEPCLFYSGGFAPSGQMNPNFRWRDVDGVVGFLLFLIRGGQYSRSSLQA